MNLSNIDLRLLQVFRAVVEAGGFTNAQAVLNISQSTISNHMAQLEGRLGFRLCDRGRSGFSLTAKGERFYHHVVAFFQSVQAFQAKAAELRGGLAGDLRLGIIDNLITDPQCPLPQALALFYAQPDNSVRIALQVLAPQELEKEVLNHTLDAAIGVFYSRVPGLCYEPLYRERDVLVCAAGHPLARLDDPRELAAAIPSARKVARTFMRQQEFPVSSADDDSVVASVASVEAAAMLILNGPFIGFLPRHYARQWLEAGQLVELLPNKFVRYTPISLVTREARQSPASALKVFLNCLELRQAA